MSIAWATQWQSSLLHAVRQSGEGVDQIPAEAGLHDDPAELLGGRGRRLGGDGVDRLQQAVPGPEASRQQLQGAVQLVGESGAALLQAVEHRQPGQEQSQCAEDQCAGEAVDERPQDGAHQPGGDAEHDELAGSEAHPGGIEGPAEVHAAADPADRRLGEPSGPPGQPGQPSSRRREALPRRALQLAAGPVGRDQGHPEDEDGGQEEGSRPGGQHPGSADHAWAGGRGRRDGGRRGHIVCYDDDRRDGLDPQFPRLLGAGVGGAG